MQTLSCNACGAPLEIPDGTRYFKCNHCGQQLAVRQTESATFTEAVDQLSKTTSQLSEQVEQLSRHNKLAQLEKQWEQERQSFMVTDKRGGQHLPTEGAAVAGGVAIVVFGCFWTAMAVGITSAAPSFGPFAVAKVAFPAFGVCFIAFGVYMAARSFKLAKEYRMALQRHQADKARILDETAEGRGE